MSSLTLIGVNLNLDYSAIYVVRRKLAKLIEFGLSTIKQHGCGEGAELTRICKFKRIDFQPQVFIILLSFITSSRCYRHTTNLGIIFDMY